MTVISPEIVEDNRYLIAGILSVVVNHLVLVSYIALVVCSSPVFPSQMIMVSHWSLSSKGLITDEAMSSLVMFIFLLLRNNHRFDIFQDLVYRVVFLDQAIQESFDHILSSIDDWFLSVLIGSTDNHVGKA